MTVDFAKRYPEVAVEMIATGRVVGLVEEGFDVAIRTGRLADSTLIARPLGGIRRIVVASGAYLKKRGRPRTPAALEKHDAIVFGAGAERSTWRLVSDDDAVDVAVRARLVTNDFDLLVQAAAAGIGVALVPTYRSVGELRAGRLERVLAAYCSPVTAVYAVYPSTRHLSPKVRAFVEYLQAKFTPPPWELGPAP